MKNCTDKISITLINDKCKGVKTSTDCIIYESAIATLGLPTNSTITEVIDKLLLVINRYDERVNELEERIFELENIGVK